MMKKPSCSQKVVIALTLWEPSDNVLQTLCISWGACSLVKQIFGNGQSLQTLCRQYLALVLLSYLKHARRHSLHINVCENDVIQSGLPYLMESRLGLHNLIKRQGNGKLKATSLICGANHKTLTSSNSTWHHCACAQAGETLLLPPDFD